MPFFPPSLSCREAQALIFLLDEESPEQVSRLHLAVTAMPCCSLLMPPTQTISQTALRRCSFCTQAVLPTSTRNASAMHCALQVCYKFNGGGRAEDGDDAEEEQRSWSLSAPSAISTILLHKHFVGRTPSCAHAAVTSTAATAGPSLLKPCPQPSASLHSNHS